MTWTHGHFFWNELMTRDAEKAKKFYGDTLGWRFDGMPMPDGTYWVAKTSDKPGDRPVGGIFTMNGAAFDGVPEHWMGYIAVDDIDARLKKAQSAGATVLKPAFEIPGVGRIAILKEPGAAVVGWITPATQ
ncbi:MAG TPA: VOC family protein [Pseudolabrys sp.]|nr:VOC family protein [Pseudolabrys sp.]